MDRGDAHWVERRLVVQSRAAYFMLDNNVCWFGFDGW